MWNAFKKWLCGPEPVETVEVEEPKVEVPVVPEVSDHEVIVYFKERTRKALTFSVSRRMAQEWKAFDISKKGTVTVHDSDGSSFTKFELSDVLEIVCARKKKAEEPKSLQADTSAAIPRRFDYKAIDPSMLQDAQDVLRIIGPYLPVLRRASDEVYEGFLKHFNNREWESIDLLLYEKMTKEERADLLDSVYQDARAAAIARFERIKLEKELAWKILTSILIKVVL